MARNVSREKGRKKIKKRREAYKRRKEQQLCIETVNGCIVEILVNNNIDITIHVSRSAMSQLVDGQDVLNKENMDANETNDCLLYAKNIGDILISNRLASNLTVVNMTSMPTIRGSLMNNLL